MCGITGWVSYQDDLNRPEQRAILDRMSEVNVCRGPDDGGTWTASHVAFGHRRLAVIDIEGGAQPMVITADGRPLLVLTYSGEVYNYRELRAELGRLGHHFRTASDTEVVLHAYLEWGGAFVDRLNGMYAFGLWDARTEELLLVRDRMGIKPLYWYATSDGVLFGSEPKSILAHPDVRATVAADGLTEILAFVKTPGHAIFGGMRELPPGHVLRVSRTGSREIRYWSLPAREHTDDRDTTVAHVRELLDDIVARQLVSDVPLCTLLSGGLDSSALTALAADRTRADGLGTVRSFAVDFTGYTENFAPNAMRGTPDAPYVHMLAERSRTEHTDIVLDAAALLDPGPRQTALGARDLPLGIGDGDTSLYLLFRAIRERSTVALSGESADEVFGGYRWFHDRESVYADTFPWLASMTRLGGFGGTDVTPREGLFDPALLARIELDARVRDHYHDALLEVPHPDGVTDPHERRMREICYLHLTRFVQMLLDRKDRMSMAVGLEVRVPFCDHRLVEYVFNTPWSLKNFDGYEKSLLRAATRDVLPAEIAERRKSPYPSIQDPAYTNALRRELDALLADRDAPVRPLLDPDAARKAVHGTGDEARAAIEVVLSTDAWLRRYGVRVEV
ncbi:asparagine synthase (glutamine-hydrolyzing) [Embleya sp. AB8]|uniref:asparagine synthase (glutamine-hydrolyzing) n=1 Tax=Embleya sp. AB8 TaxID=3156304 RepID=UPI003C792795